MPRIDKAELRAEALRLAPWTHQIDLGRGIRTRELGGLGDKPVDHPRWRWDIVSPAFPQDMTGMRVLDIGCADGFFTIEAARRGAEVVAIDQRAVCIRRLRFASGALRLKNIEARVGSIDDLSDDLGHFDLILFLAVLYHLEAPYRDLARVAKFGERMIIESSCIAHPDPFLFFERPTPMHPVKPKYFPTMACVEDMLCEAGYSRIEMFATSGEFGAPVELPADPTARPDPRQLPKIRAFWTAER